MRNSDLLYKKQNLLVEANIRYQLHKQKIQKLRNELEPCEKEAGSLVDGNWQLPSFPQDHPCWKMNRGKLCKACSHNVPIAAQIRELRKASGAYASAVSRLTNEVISLREKLESLRKR